MRQKTLVRFMLMLAVTVTAVASDARPANRRDVQVSLVQSIERSGANVKVALEDGTILEIPAARLRVHDATSRQAGAISADSAHGQKRIASLVDGKSKSRTPAAIHAMVRPDGRVKRARIHLFKSETEAASFVKTAKERRAAVEAKRASKSDQ